jgi:hypothetical protein
MSGGKALAQVTDDEAILKCLDDNWRTVTQIRSRLGVPATTTGLIDGLRRLAKVGQIERHALETAAPKRRGHAIRGKFAIEFFRRSP